MQTVIHVSSHRQWSRPLSERANLSDENLKVQKCNFGASLPRKIFGLTSSEIVLQAIPQ